MPEQPNAGCSVDDLEVSNLKAAIECGRNSAYFRCSKRTLDRDLFVNTWSATEMFVVVKGNVDTIKW